MRKRLLLINPTFSSKPKGYIAIGQQDPPLGLGILAALTPDNWDIEIIDENFGQFSYKEADLVGITAFTLMATRAYHIAGIYRKNGIHTVMGGIHASLMSKEALEYVDTVVIGEAEPVWNDLLKDFENNSIKRVYGPIIADMNNIPKPRRDLFDKRYTFGSIQTTRGCPLNCDFCSVAAFNGNQYRHRPIEHILDELENIPQEMIFFSDDNLIGTSKQSQERAIALFKGMIERKIKKQWACQSSINVSDNEEVLKYARESGCTVVLIGIESEDEESLNSVNKKLNAQRISIYERTFDLLHKYGILVLGTFIFGFDTDTIQALYKRKKYILQSGVDIFFTTILTPLPGTKLFKKISNQNRFLCTNFPDDWSKFHFEDIVFKPANINPSQFFNTVKDINKSLYSYKNLLGKSFKTLMATKKLRLALYSFYRNNAYKKAIFSYYDEKQLKTRLKFFGERVKHVHI